MLADISVIVPVYNTPIYKIRRCIDSILQQTILPLEIVIVDDGSGNECADFCRKLESEHSGYIKLIRRDNKGAGVARNVGVENASGKYVTFVDSDDMIARYAIEVMVNGICSNIAPDLIIGLVKKYKENDLSILERTRRCNNSFILIDSEAKRKLLVNHILGKAWKDAVFECGYIGDGPVARVVKKEIALEVPFLEDKMWSEDSIWNLFLIKHCELIHIYDDIVYSYNYSANSNLRKYRENCIFEFETRIEQEYEFVTEMWPECLDGLYILIWREMISLGRSFFFHKDNSNSFLRNYILFNSVTKNYVFKNMLKEIDFKSESNKKKRIAKELLRRLTLIGPKVLAYFIWKRVCRIDKKLFS